MILSNLIDYIILEESGDEKEFRRTTVRNPIVTKPG